MFGGWGLYLHGRMFGLITEGQLYLKADDLTRPDFERAGVPALHLRRRAQVGGLRLLDAARGRGGRPARHHPLGDGARWRPPSARP